MPVRKLSHVAPSPTHALLKDRLLWEWQSTTSTADQPVIIEEDTGANQPVHVYVIWDEWQQLPQLERSEIIMDAFEEKYGQQQSLNVTVAMGLTPIEADRLGIRYQ
jgi:hypothetical protein